MRPIKPLCYFTMVLLGFCLSSAMKAAESSPQGAATAEALVKQATFIFVGTVLRLKATTIPEVQPSDSTAVVRVDEVLEGAGAPPDLKGKEITVQLIEASSIKAGTETVFYTRGWLFGESMAVIEIGRPSEGQSSAQVRELVSATHQKMASDALLNDIASAEAIVVGTVTSVKPASIRHIGSEHDPDWYEAEINVESVEKGNLPSHTLTILFPHSDDVIWQSAPKFKQGQQGIWLLHRNQEKLPGISDRYTALKPLDFQTRESLERIRTLRKALA